MALIIITLEDDGNDEVSVTVVANPGINLKDEEALLTGAQVAALNMLQALQFDIKTDHGLKALISKEPL